MKCREHCTSHRLLDGRFHMGGPDHHVSGSIQDDALPGPLVQEQHLALTRHHVLCVTELRQVSGIRDKNGSINKPPTCDRVYPARQQTCKVPKS